MNNLYYYIHSVISELEMLSEVETSLFFHEVSLLCPGDSARNKMLLKFNSAFMISS